MFGTGTSSWWGRLGSATKVAVAATAASLTLTAAVAAALVVPSGGSGSDSAVLRNLGAAGGTVDVPTSTPATDVQADVQAGGEASVPTPTGSPSTATNASGRARAGVATSSTPLPSVPLPSLPTSIPDLGGSLPDLSGLANIPNQVMACLEPIFDLVSSMPSMPSMDQIMGIGPAIVSCITGIVADLPLPSGINACVSEIMGFVNDLMSQLPSGMPDVSGLDVAACIPSGLPVPTGFGGFFGGGFPFGR